MTYYSQNSKIKKISPLKNLVTFYRFFREIINFQEWKDFPPRDFDKSLQMMNCMATEWHRWKNWNFTVWNLQNNNRFWLCYLMRPAARAWEYLKISFKKCLKNVFYNTLFWSFVLLCEYLLELLELSRSIWFSFYGYAFYSSILLTAHSIRTSFISTLFHLFQSTKIWVNHLKSSK